eukprot:jgi/Tetstr1/447194/TSEL_034631.t1
MGINRALPNEKVRNRLTAFMYRLGVVLTLGMSKHPKVGPVWNRTVEPVVVDLVDNLAYAVQEGLVKGLRSDNVPPAPSTHTHTCSFADSQTETETETEADAEADAGPGVVHSVEDPSTMVTATVSAVDVSPIPATQTAAPPRPEPEPASEPAPRRRYLWWRPKRD